VTDISGETFRKRLLSQYM